MDFLQDRKIQLNATVKYDTKLWITVYPLQPYSSAYLLGQTLQPVYKVSKVRDKTLANKNLWSSKGEN
jgi:hypothetical protein